MYFSLSTDAAKQINVPDEVDMEVEDCREVQEKVVAG